MARQLGPRHAILSLPDELTWSTRCGESDPPLGWYSAGFGRRVPSTTLAGVGNLHGRLMLGTELVFADVLPSRVPQRAVRR